MEAQLVTAPGDGISPAVLLTLGHRLKGQYLFNVPEGLSRLVLEHKIRPTLDLRAAFCTDLLSLTGFSGLVMRLRGEGHNQVQVMGPLGTLPTITGLSHFVHWRCPAVLVSELTAAEEAQCYEDEHMAVAALWRPQCAPGERWKTPPWLAAADLPGAMQQDGETAAEGGSSESESDTSEPSSEGTASSSSSDGSEGTATSNSSSDADANAAAAMQAEAAIFGGVGDFFALQGGTSREEVVRRLSARGGAMSAMIAPPQPSACQQRHGESGSGGEVFEIGGRQFQAYTRPGINVYVEPKMAAQAASGGTKGSANGGSNAAAQHEPESVLAYLCHIRLTGQLLLITSLQSAADMQKLQRHKAVACLQQQADRVAAVIHMVPSGMSTSLDFQLLTEELPGPQLVMERPGPAGYQGLGFLAAARTTAKLNLVSSTVFPLPPALRCCEGWRSPPGSADADSATAAAVGLAPTELLTSGVKHVALLSRVAWRQNGAALQVAEGCEPGAVDFQAVQQAVLQLRPELVEQLQQLHGAHPVLRQSLLEPQGPFPAPPVQQHEGPRKRSGDASIGAPTASNKRAAADLRARLQHKPPPDGAAPPAAAAAAAEVSPPVYVPPLRTHPPPPLRVPPPGGWLNQCSSNGTASRVAAEPGVTFLGTGCAEPSKYRGASAIHLTPGGGRGILLDCGEGALGQLVRLHGFAGAVAAAAALSCVWVSHRHADHMAGMLSLLAARPPSAPPLLLLGPRSLRDWLAEAAPPLRLRYDFVHSADLADARHRAHSALRRALGLTHVRSVPVRHCADAFGVVLRHAGGWSVVYSGDTQPCESLVRAGAGATLLIHEATFEPALLGEAQRKRHSTTDQALQVARRMGAFRTILTHFSQRYPKFPEGVLEESGAEEGGPKGEEPRMRQAGGVVGGQPGVSGAAGRTAVAFDGMCVPLAMLPQLPALMAAAAAVLAAGSGANGAEAEAGRLALA